jgi:hypothetical protein
MATQVYGAPGVFTGRTIQYRNIHTNRQAAAYAPSFYFFDGNLSRDPDSSPVSSLRCGLIIGKVTTTGLYANSVIGLTSANYTSGGTSLTLTSQAATELNRRVGASGTFTLQGAPTASGTMAKFTVTYSAVNTTTGVVTVTNIGADVALGAYVMPTDGSQVPVSVFDNDQGLPIDVLDASGASINQPIHRQLIRGDLIATSIINLTEANASSQSWMKGQLQASGRAFTFDNDR